MDDPRRPECRKKRIVARNCGARKAQSKRECGGSLAEAGSCQAGVSPTARAEIRPDTRPARFKAPVSQPRIG